MPPKRELKLVYLETAIVSRIAQRAFYVHIILQTWSGSNESFMQMKKGMGII